jgi:hypothetical protein
MTLCGTAKRRRSNASTRAAKRGGPEVPESTDIGTGRSPTKPTAYGKTARKTRWLATP